ncbi:MAG: DEAD/DEAH box helicase, partial [Bacteroidota bacterium]
DKGLVFIFYLCTMTDNRKDLNAILTKLNIDQLNPMQVKAFQMINQYEEVVLLSPTGTGKTLAFLLPLLEKLNPIQEVIQLLIVVPSRELAIQIEQVAREMGSGYKVNAVYGGRAGAKDKIDLKHAPAILIGTPGRLADHIRNDHIDPSAIESLVLDEFDKSLEVGFEEEMKEIVDALPTLKNKVLTSATNKTKFPSFLNLINPQEIDFIGEQSRNQLDQILLTTDQEDKLDILIDLLHHVGRKNGIIFCNFKDSIKHVSEHLRSEGIHHVCFYGGMEQKDRERSLIKFRNGSSRILLATDLAARGIDIPELDFIVHYQLPIKETEFIHRNGRTARMNSEGTAYILRWTREKIPSFINEKKSIQLKLVKSDLTPSWTTLFLSGGRKDKISKGDVAGLFFKQGKLSKEELGMIELKQDCAFVAVAAAKASKVVNSLNNSRLKKKKVRISILNN